MKLNLRWRRHVYNRLWKTCLLLTLLVAYRQPAKAQGNGTGGTARLGELIRQGRYDAVIAQATWMLQQPGHPDPDVLYLRGYAEYRIAWFGAAETDLDALDDYRPNSHWPQANELVQQVERLRVLCPPHMQEVRADGKVAFRVYYDEETPWTQAIIALLPEGLRIGQSLFGVKAYENAVFIFSRRERMDAFNAVLDPKQRPDTWTWAKGSTGLLYFSRTDGKASKPAEDIKGDYFRGAVVHEYTHSLLHRALGTRHIPTWMDEGTAMFVESRLVPHLLTQNDEEIKRCVADKAFLPLTDLDADTTFYASVEKQTARRPENAPPYAGPDAYEQALSMVRALWKHDSSRDFVRFVDLYAESGEMESAFRAAFGTSTADFYAAWLKKTNASNASKSE